MPKPLERVLLVLSDYIAFAVAFAVLAWMRNQEGFFAITDFGQLWSVASLVFLFWAVLFTFFGMYRSWYAQSRLEEFFQIIKTITLGTVIIFILTADLKQDVQHPLAPSRLMILSYWLVAIASVSAGRMALRSVQRSLLAHGVGNRNSLIVGWNNEARNLLDQLQRHPALGYRVVGFVADRPQPSRVSYRGVPLLGTVADLGRLTAEYEIEEILIALGKESRERLADIIDRCNGRVQHFKMLPDMYDVLIGQIRTQQLYGLPLVEIMPGPMSSWERVVKRMMDVAVSLVVLAVFAPIWLVVAVAIKVDSRGPVLYRQQRVGRDGKLFTIYKFRSMVENAESETGPKWAERDDPRITRVGHILRKLRIDEIPQFINVLKGDMSLVGPRPERPFFVEQFKKEIPLYLRRTQVRPGITGWAQIKGKYDRSLEDVKRKLKYDLYYLENMSLKLDLKILVRTFYVMLTGRGQ